MRVNKLMRRVVRREVLISSLSDTRREILDCASTCAVEDSHRVFLGTWSLLDLLAHLTGWDHANVEAIQAVQAGRLPLFYRFHDRGWQSYNATLVRKYRRASLEEQIGQAASSHLRLMEELGDVPSEDIDRDFCVRFRGFRITVGRLMEGEGRDEAEHLAQVKKFLESAGGERKSSPGSRLSGQ